ncbi:MAG: M1 family aminopeptidase [Fidelibacterota bacterium]
MKRFVIVLFIFSTAFPQVSYDNFRCTRSRPMERFISGQRTVNQEKVNIAYYGINLEIQPDSQSISGFVCIAGSVVDSTLTAFEYNLHNNMIVDSIVTDSGQPNFTHSNGIIAWTPESAFVPGDSFLYTIYYHGAPAATGFGSFRFDQRNGRTLISTLSEPYGARDWWPCKDDPADKADSVDIFITVPNEYIVASNGTFIGLDLLNPYTQRWHWQETYPITTYLVSLAIYPYFTWTEQYVSPLSGTIMPVNYYVFPEDSVPAMEDFNITTEAIGIFAQLFGEYPFIREKYGMASFPWSGAMEHQTCTSYGHDLIRGDHYYDWILVHELAHQWWGDLITCQDFHHIWLNEGFATYSEALWVEQRSGPEAFRQYIDSRMGFETWWADPPVYRYDVTGSGDIFHTTVYKKGAWVLHMLRHVVGDSAFITILQTYAADSTFAYGNATTETFRDLCESVSGFDLDSFFNQWIYQSYYPNYGLSYHGSDTVTITVTQSTPDGNLFTMPVDFKIVATDTVLYREWVVDEDHEVFHVVLPPGQIVTDVVLDPDNWILKQVSYLATNENQIQPSTYGITALFPNPFNANLTIELAVQPNRANEIAIYDLQGREVWNDHFIPIQQQRVITWQGRNHFGEALPSGVYMLVYRSESIQEERKLVLLK